MQYLKQTIIDYIVLEKKKLDCLKHYETLKESSLSITCTSDHLLICVTLCLDIRVHFIRISETMLQAWHKATHRAPATYDKCTVCTIRNN